ncbi:MAG: CapA family protein [Coriobacteriia bacterium]|nr:CapA family protein [Coriobacteriia bacterium]
MPAAAPVEPPAPSLPATLTVAAVGDMHFDRRVKELIGREGGLAPLKYVADRLAAADVAVGNLESPLSNGGTPWPDKDVRFRGDPRGIESLVASDFTFLSLANNHILDYGTEALMDTVSALDLAGIGYAGAGIDRAAAWKPAVETYGDTTVAFLSFSHILPAGFVAGEDRAGLAPGRTDMGAVTEAISAAKAEHDYVLVSFHWGVEYVDDANADQVRDARAAIDAGADMVLSHHPHVIQGVELYNGGLIAYSLGDFVFDHYSRKTGEAFILEADLGPHGIANVRAVPVYLYQIGQPKVVTGSEATDILERLKRISSPHGTSVVIEGDVAQVLP